MNEALNETTIPLRVLQSHFRLPESAVLRVFEAVGREYDIPQWRVRKAFRKTYLAEHRLPGFVMLFYKEVIVLEQQRYLNGHAKGRRAA